MVATLDQLLGDARAAGFPATPRLISDWERRGLVDYRHSPGRGRGKGRGQGTWSDHQRRLFQQLIRLRPTVRRLATLANVVVWLWLAAEDEVPLAQARRAFKTWIDDATNRGWKYGMLSAREAVRLLADESQDPSTRRDLTDRLATALHAKADPDSVTRGLLRMAFDPLKAGRLLGAPGAPISPDLFIEQLGRRHAAWRALARLPDSSFEQARLIYRTSWSVYLTERPRLWETSAPETKGMFAPPSLSDIVGQACSDLLAIVGLLLVEED